MSAGTLTRGASGGGGGGVVVDPRLRARHIEVARGRARRRLRRLLVVLVLLAVVAGAVVASRSALLDVDHVEIAGVDRADAAALRSVAGIRRGEAMASLDTGAVTARLEDQPWVAEASVTRSWPGTVEIGVEEREPVAVTTDPAPLVVDVTGMVLGPATVADLDLPAVGPGGSVEVGERLAEPRVALLRLLDRTPDDLRTEVDRAVLLDDGVGVRLVDGIEVHLCDTSRLAAKFAGLRSLLALDGRDTVATIDLCVPNSSALTRAPQGGA